MQDIDVQQASARTLLSWRRARQLQPGAWIGVQVRPPSSSNRSSQRGTLNQNSQVARVRTVMTSSVMYLAVYKCPNKSVQEHYVVFQTIHLSISNHPRDLVLLMASVSRVLIAPHIWYSLLHRHRLRHGATAVFATIVFGSAKHPLHI